MSKIIFVDGSELRIDKADVSNSEQQDDLYVICDGHNETLFEVNVSQIKYIEW